MATETRLIRVTNDLLDLLGTRNENGDRLTFTWGEPDQDGVYTPTVYTHQDYSWRDTERHATVERIRERITYNPMVAETPVGDLLASEVLDQMFAILDEEAR